MECGIWNFEIRDPKFEHRDSNFLGVQGLTNDKTGLKIASFNFLIMNTRKLREEVGLTGWRNALSKLDVAKILAIGYFGGFAEMGLIASTGAGRWHVRDALHEHFVPLEADGGLTREELLLPVPACDDVGGIPDDPGVAEWVYGLSHMGVIVECDAVRSCVRRCVYADESPSVDDIYSHCVSFDVLSPPSRDYCVSG